MEEPDLDILGLLDRLDDLIHNAKGASGRPALFRDHPSVQCLGLA
jgi:hypothetical protein